MGVLAVGHMPTAKLINLLSPPQDHVTVTVHAAILTASHPPPHSPTDLHKAMTTPNLVEIDPEYEQRMLAFDIDCDNGKGDAWACHSVGEYYAVVKVSTAALQESRDWGQIKGAIHPFPTHPVPQGDYNKAGKVYTDNCSKYSHPPSCFNLGRLFLGGRGVPQNDAKSLKCFETSCKGGHGMACHHMGLLLLYGKEGGYDVAKDPKRATGILDKGCQEGIPDSCYALASHLLRTIPADKSHKRDPVRAKGLLEKGCGLGNGPSCFNLAVMHKKGDVGIPVNEQEHQKYKDMMERLVQQTGSLQWKKGH